jgi:hypothetical protein
MVWGVCFALLRSGSSLESGLQLALAPMSKGANGTKDCAFRLYLQAGSIDYQKSKFRHCQLKSTLFIIIRRSYRNFKQCGVAWLTKTLTHSIRFHLYPKSLAQREGADGADNRRQYLRLRVSDYAIARDKGFLFRSTGSPARNTYYRLLSLTCLSFPQLFFGNLQPPIGSCAKFCR